MSVHLGVEIGDTGSRMRAVDDAGRIVHEHAVEALTQGSAAEEAIALIRAYAAARPRQARAVCSIVVGAAGFDARGVEHTSVLRALVAAVPDAPRTTAVLALDVVTAHLGALGGDAGAVVALGIGATGLGTDHRDRWRRTDGWGPDYGDRGGAAWIGRAGLEAAARAADGVEPAADGLLRAAVDRLGPPRGWASSVFHHPDRARALAAFAHDVIALADADGAADDIVMCAADEAARTAVAALGADLPGVVSVTGALTAHARYLEEVRRALGRRSRVVEVRSSAGSSLDGAMLLARQAASGRVNAVPGFVWS